MLSCNRDVSIPKIQCCKYHGPRTNRNEMFIMKDIYTARMGALPLPKFCDNDSISRSRASAFVSSCCALRSRPDGRGHGSHVVNDDKVLDRERDLGKVAVATLRR